MKILHIENTAGIGKNLSDIENDHGNYSRVLITEKSAYSYEHDYEKIYNKKNIFNTLFKINDVVKLTKEFDIVHVHSGINWKRIDLIIIGINNPIVVHYHGSESRMGYGMYYKFLIDQKIIATPDLIKYHPTATFIPNPILVNKHYHIENYIPKIVHIPTNRKLKGTPFILSIIKLLKQNNVKFEFNLYENLTHNETLKIINDSDIVIDQINNDIDFPALFGLISLEAIALGKISIANVNEKYIKQYCTDLNEFPIYNVNYNNCYNMLKELIEDASLRKKYQELGKNYIEKYHNSNKIYEQTMKIYEKALNK